jgi:hypothetical protein
MNKKREAKGTKRNPEIRNLRFPRVLEIREIMGNNLIREVTLKQRTDARWVQETECHVLWGQHRGRPGDSPRPVTAVL